MTKIRVGNIRMMHRYLKVPWCYLSLFFRYSYDCHLLQIRKLFVIWYHSYCDSIIIVSYILCVYNECLNLRLDEFTRWWSITLIQLITPLIITCIIGLEVNFILTDNLPSIRLSVTDCDFIPLVAKATINKIDTYDSFILQRENIRDLYG